MKRFCSWLLILMMLVTLLPVSVGADESESSDVLSLPSQVKEVGVKAFEGDTTFSKVIVPSTVTAIGSRAFGGCTGISEVWILSTSITIAKDAFADCGAITFHVYSGSPGELFARSNGFKCSLLDERTDNDAGYSRLFGSFQYSAAQSADQFSSKTLIIRTASGTNRLPDISDYMPEAVFQSEDDLFYVKFATAELTESCYNAMCTNSNVENVECDIVYAEDGVVGESVTMSGQWLQDAMGFDEYSDFVALHAKGNVTVAVIDSGVFGTDWSGQLDTQKAVSFVGGSALNDSLNHGTRVASIISDCLGAAVSRVTLLPIKVLNSTGAYRTTTIVEGMRYAIEHGADIINLSIGWANGESAEIKHQIDVANEKGIQVVVAAGNDSGKVLFPANYSGSIAVSALTYSASTGYSVNSRTGAEIDYTAPGNYLSTKAYPRIDEAGDILGAASTSFAAPQIAAAFALIRMDATHSGSPIEILDSCCSQPDLAYEQNKSTAYGKGFPQLQELAVIPAGDIVLEMEDPNEPIPSWMWTEEEIFLYYSIVPENSTEKTVTVEVSDPSVLSVRQHSRTSSVQITPKKTGEATLTFTCGEITKRLTLTVRQPVTRITITGAFTQMIKGKTQQLTAVVEPDDAENRAVTWTSSNEAIATVSATGLVTAVDAGSVRITCRAQDGFGEQDSVDIKVIGIPDPEYITINAAEMDISGGEATLEVGDTLTLVTAVYPAEASQKVTYRAIPANRVITVSETGVIEAVAPGSALLIVTTENGKVTGDVEIIVEKVPVSLNVTAEKTTLDVGEPTNVYAEVMPSDASNKTVTWTSSNTAVATVNKSTGVVRAIGPGTAVITGTTFNGVIGSVTLTVRRPITLTLNPNGGSCTVTSMTVYSGFPIGELPEASRSNWTFAGWYTAIYGGTRATSTSVYDVNTTLYAHWTGNPYTVTFDPNGGTVTSSTMTGTVGTSLGALPQPTRDSYVFLGWFTAAEGGTEVTALYSQKTADALALYAHWQPMQYNIIFNANGGTVTPGTMTGTVNVPLDTLPTPNRSYYVFNGWFTSAEGGTWIDAGYTQATTADLKLYAHYSPMSYNISFDANGGSCATETKLSYVDTPVGTLPTPTRSYYNFNGWYTAANGGTLVTENYQRSVNSAFTVYAQWTPQPYTMTFDANGGSCDISTQTCYVDTAVSTLPVPVRAYYTFLGWFTENNGTQVTSTYTQSTTDPITVYAQWTGDPYTITFDPNGGSCTTTTKTGYVAQIIDTLPTPTRTDYTFNGWFTQPSGGVQVTRTHRQSTTDPLTLYAQWTLITYTITLNANGGTVTPGTVAGTAGQAIGVLPVPTRDYYTFAGWYTRQDEGILVTADYVKSTTDGITFYAHWTDNPVLGPVLPDNIPDGARAVQTVYSYHETSESTSADMEGWTVSGSHWNQVDQGSMEYCKFPSGFNKDHTLYKTIAHEIPYEASETETTKREVTSERTSYIFWHWMFDCGGANAGNRAINNKKTDSYKYFGAHQSTKGYTKKGNYYNNDTGITTYHETPWSSNKDSQGSYYWFRENCYTYTYTDYEKIYELYRDVQYATVNPVGSPNVSDIVEYVYYQDK